MCGNGFQINNATARVMTKKMVPVLAATGKKGFGLFLKLSKPFVTPFSCKNFNGEHCLGDHINER